jgi:transcriptional regulator with XRE-family HTH domain
MTEWGKELKRLRKEKGWGQKQLIYELFRLNPDRYEKTKEATISHWESGDDLPSREKVADLAEVFGLSLVDKIRFLMLAGYAPEEEKVRQEILNLYRQGVGIDEVVKQLTELGHQMESEHFEQVRLLKNLPVSISQQIASKYALPRQDKLRFVALEQVQEGEAPLMWIIQEEAEGNRGKALTLKNGKVVEVPVVVDPSGTFWIRDKSCSHESTNR